MLREMYGDALGIRQGSGKLPPRPSDLRQRVSHGQDRFSTGIDIRLIVAISSSLRGIIEVAEVAVLAWIY